MTPKKSRRWSKKSSQVTPETKSPSQIEFIVEPKPEVAPIPESWQEKVIEERVDFVDEDSKGETSKKDKLILIFGSIFVGLIVICTVLVGYLDKTQRKSSDKVTVEVITPSPTVVVQPSVAPEVGIVIMNASGKSGLAGKLATNLRGEGIANIEIGNSDKKMAGNYVNLPDNVKLDKNLEDLLNKYKFSPYVLGVSNSEKIELVIGE